MLKAKSEDKNAPEILDEVFKLLGLKLDNPEFKTQAIKNDKVTQFIHLYLHYRKTPS